MLFNSISFIIFFPIVALIYFIIPSRVKYIWLLVCSYFFYMCWNVKYALLLLFSTVITYISGWVMEYISKSKRDLVLQIKYKKIVVFVSCFLNLLILFFYKYFDFFIINLNRVFSKLNISFEAPQLNLLLPVGISFYIFQALSYTIDIYRDEIEHEKNFLRYALFVSFFPQLVAGPIERSKNLLGQLRSVNKFSYENMKIGLLQMLWGYFMKLVIADRAAVLVNEVFNNIKAYDGFYIWIATFMFAFQIYCDFSGYSMIAIGAARVMGFRLMENFNAPYLSQSVAEFWRRWHISLSSWFRDYVYIPLGGSRKGVFRTYINIMIVFLISGLWHGASWTFVIWGALNGLFQVVGQLSMPLRNRVVAGLHMNRESFSHKFMKTIITFCFVSFTWIFFRANSLKEAYFAIKQSINYNLWIFFDDSIYNMGLDMKEFHLLLFAIIILFIADIMKYRGKNFLAFISKQELWFRWLFYIISIIFVLVFGMYGTQYDASAFIYFQF